MFSEKNAIFYGDRISLGYLLALIFAQLAWPTPLANWKGLWDRGSIDLKSESQIVFEECSKEVKDQLKHWPDFWHILLKENISQVLEEVQMSI